MSSASGEAICRNCGHKFVAIVPAGVAHFECPLCEEHKAVFSHYFGAQDGEFEFICSTCGCHDFFIYKKTANATGEIHCRGCGLEITGWF